MALAYSNLLFRKSRFHLPLFICLCKALCIGEEPSPPHFPDAVPIEQDTRLSTADDHFLAGLYTNAIDLYQNILDKPSNANENSLPTQMQARFRLAQAYFSMGSFENALQILQKNIDEGTSLPSESTAIRQNSIYLLALVYKKMARFDDALQTFERYLAAGSPSPQPLQQEAQFEIGLIHFLKGDMERTRIQFESQHDNPASRLSILRQLYLAKIHLAQNNISQSMSLLDLIAKQLPPDDDLHYELSYLRGEASFHSHHFLQAAYHFENALPKYSPQTSDWYGQTLHFLGWSYLNMADALQTLPEERSRYFNKAETFFQTLLAHQPDEKIYLTLGQYYLIRAKKLNDPSAYALAEEMLTQKGQFTSIEAQTHALLLRAEAAPSYSLRSALYQQIINPENRHSSFYGKGWFLHGLNEFEQGKSLIKTGDVLSGKKALTNAAAAFQQASTFLKKDQGRAASAAKYEALALSEGDDGDFLAWNRLDHLIHAEPDLLHAAEFPDEIYYLHGFFALRLANTINKPIYSAIAESSLKSVASTAKSKFGDIALNHLASWHYREGNYAHAEALYIQLTQDFPASFYQPEAWLWAAYCADKQNKDREIGMLRRRHILEHYPQSPHAAEAYFTLYSYADYLQGNRDTLKHLHHFSAKYPETPYLMQAYYLIGLDCKRNRKTPEGRWIRRKSLTGAIEAFQNVETCFDALIAKNSIPSDKMNFYTNIYYQSILEKALANLAIGDESQGAKRQIYLEYAEDVLKSLIAKVTSKTENIPQNGSYFALYEESTFWLAQTFIKRGKDDEAEKLLLHMIDQQRQAAIAHSCYHSRTAYELGNIALRKENYLQALGYLKESEKIAKGSSLPTDERLDIWIQQSYCYRNMQQFDDAVLILSKVANDNAISTLRLKAMYLRAEIYELQNRPELARKQLESLAKKGGDWALKAQNKLETTYAY